MTHLRFAGAALLFLSVGAAAQQPAVDPARVEKAVADTFRNLQPEWQARVDQDETQKICSATRNRPSAAEADVILAREKANVVLPADGKVVGDWKEGEKIAQRGTGGQFSDTPETPRGGNCYACHQLSKIELSYGTLGPSLLGYGRDRKFEAEAAKAAYAKIWNPQSVLPCSQMPRFGHNKVLSEQQIRDLVGLLFDPASPVNQ